MEYIESSPLLFVYTETVTDHTNKKIGEMVSTLVQPLEGTVIRVPITNTSEDMGVQKSEEISWDTLPEVSHVAYIYYL